MKKLFILSVVVLLYLTSQAQSRLITATFQKNNVPGIENEIPFPEKTVIKSIEEQLMKLGYRGNNNKGYLIFKGVRLPQFGNDSYDLYFKTERKSRKEKDLTSVTLLISAGYEKFIGDTTNAQVIQNAKNYLDNLTAKAAAYDLEQQITAQEKLAEKSSKKLNSLLNDGQDLQKKKNKLENDISNNLRDQANQKTNTDNEQQILQTLKDKRMQ